MLQQLNDDSKTFDAVPKVFVGLTNDAHFAGMLWNSDSQPVLRAPLVVQKYISFEVLRPVLLLLIGMQDSSAKRLNQRKVNYRY